MFLRTALAFCLALLRRPSPALAATESAPAIEVWKSPTCGCCGKWVEHLEANGFAVKAKNTSPAMLDRIKRQAGIDGEARLLPHRQDRRLCHRGPCAGGRHQAAGVKSVRTRIGLTVPNMPIGSPGMEQPDGETEPYDVLLVKKDGSAEVFASH